MARARKSESSKGGNRWARSAGLLRVETRLTPEEYAAVQQAAEKSEQSVAAFLKSQLLSHREVKRILKNPSD